MEDNLFTNSEAVSDRVIHTPSIFAKQSLIYLQEVGRLTATGAHTSRREKLTSFLFFYVLDGSGVLNYKGQKYNLKKGDCVFIDCVYPYSHSTFKDLWTLKWVHFSGVSMKNIYSQFLERGGEPVFTPRNSQSISFIIDKIYELASATDSVREVKISELLLSLLSLVIEDELMPSDNSTSHRRKDLSALISYLDENHTKKISLDTLSEIFFINKFYLTRIFKQQTGMSINDYILQKRITHAKALLQFSQKTMEEIGEECGIGDSSYFSKTFKKVEGISPKDFRKMWQT